MNVNRMNAIHHLLAVVILTVGCLVASGALEACQNPRSAVEAGIIGLRITDDACKEIETATGDAGTLPEWVTLSCNILDGVTPRQATVTMARAQWTMSRVVVKPCPGTWPADGGLLKWDASQGKGGGL